MKTIIKIVLVVGILIAIFGTATVKQWLTIGVNKGVDAIDSGIDQIKNSQQFNDLKSEMSSKMTIPGMDDITKGLKSFTK